MDNSTKPERKTKMRNISIFDSLQIKEQNRQNRMRIKDFKRCSLEADLWKIKEQNKENRMRIKDFKHCSLENDLWKIEEQNEQNRLRAAEYEQSVKALKKYIDHTKMMDECMNSVN